MKVILENKGGRSIALVIWLLFLALSAAAQDSLTPYLNQVYSAFELKQDLHFIRQKAEFKKYKETGLIFIGKKRFNFLMDSIQQVIEEQKQMSVKDFYLLTAPLISELEDDASYYSLKGEYAYQGKESKKFAEKIVLPVSSYIKKDSVYILKSTVVPTKSQLISINDIPAAEVAKKIWKLNSSSSKRIYESSGIYGFDFYRYYSETYCLFDFHDSVKVCFIPYEEETPVTKYIPLATPGDTYVTDQLRNARTDVGFLHLYFIQNTAVLRIDGMRTNDFSLDTLNAIFARIKNHGSSNLVIDLGSCNYSARYFWVALLNYLYKGEINLFKHHDGPVDLLKYSKKRFKKRNYITGRFAKNIEDIRFKGDVYLYTEVNTSGYAVAFADIMLYNNLVKAIYGRETGSRATQYVNRARHIIPITKLRLSLSTTLSWALDEKKHELGILPDHVLPVKNIDIVEENYYRHNKLYIQEVVDHIHKINAEL